MVTVRLHSAMRNLVGGSPRVEVQGATVREALEHLAGRHEDLARRLFDRDGGIRRFVNVFVEDEDIRHRDGLDTEVEDGQTISVLPAVAGGG
ncbi:MAG TPA: ubiquitin-like small modifier protein 1 [Actinomycetota bacterium]|jgi:MoaD family protein|nr:ubiquitin-like small modifier protein 1 [Actinomycetota bacterium]